MVDSSLDERSLQFALVHLDRAVPIAGRVGGRNPRASASAQRSTPQLPEAGGSQQYGPAAACWGLRVTLSMALAALALAFVAPFALAGAAELGNRHCLVKLADGAEHLAHKLGSRRVIRNEPGLSAAIRSIPRPRSMACPTSCTIRSRAKRLEVSTMIVRTPLPSMRFNIAAKPARVSIASAPLTAAS